MNKIRSISFLYNGSRLVVTPRVRGTFRIPTTSENGQKTVYKYLTAKEVVEHEIIKDCDPVLTLDTGEKLRVYQAGQSGYLPAMIEGLLIKHDHRENTHRSKKKGVGFNFWSSDFVEEQCGFPWEELYDDRD